MIRSRIRLPGLERALTKVRASKAALWFPGGIVVPKRQNVIAALGTPDGLLLHAGANTITVDGDLYYAELAAGEAPTNDFAAGIMELYTSGVAGIGGSRNEDRGDFATGGTLITGSNKAFDATYPMTDDQDGSNTGAGITVVTYLTSYLTSEANGAIANGLITVAAPDANSKLLTGYAFGSPFTKTSSDTLKVFVNHTVTGS